MAKAVGAIRTDETRSLGLVMLMPEFMRSNLICAFSLSDASLLLVAAVFPLISKFLTYLHHVPIKSRPYSRITLEPQHAAPKQAPRKSRSKLSKTGRSSRGSSSKKHERAVSSSEDSEDSNAIVQKKQEKRKAKAGVDAKEKERRAG